MIDIALIIASLPSLAKGALVSIQIAAIGSFMGFCGGTILGFLHRSSTRVIRLLVGIYVTVVRGTPMLIQIMFMYYLLPQLGIYLSSFWAAALAIGINSSAYVSQIIRSGIGSVSKGQIEAAYTLGLTQFQTMRYIIFPQAIVTVLPALGSEFVTLIKDSSLASTIGVMELTREGSLIRSRTYDALTVYCAVALLYLILTTTVSLVITYVERRMNRHVSR